MALEAEGNIILQILPGFEVSLPPRSNSSPSEKLGKQYQNDMFVGDIINGYLYHFKLNRQRTELVQPAGPLSDRVVNSTDLLKRIVFGMGFGGITDI